MAKKKAAKAEGAVAEEGIKAGAAEVTEAGRPKKRAAKPRKVRPKAKVEEAAEAKVEKAEAKVKEAKVEEVEEARPKVEEAQPELNIGLIGHVDHGKTTLVEKLSGKWTDTHSEEIKRGITIRLGYADAIFYKCPKCPEPACWSIKPQCPQCSAKTEAVRKVSFIDAPGHESLMATMLCGANIMDAALLLIAANEPCPQPQTKEHLIALDIIGVKHLVVAQNKIDLVSKEEAMKNYEQIKALLKGTMYEAVAIIPISAKHNINIDALIAAIQQFMPTPARDPTKDPLMLVARSFDVNKPGTPPEKLVGGVLGGALKQGKLKVGDEIELRPGREVEEKNIKVWKPFTSTIQSLVSGGRHIKEVGPGGSIGLQTLLDPSVVKSDSLTGSIVGLPGKLPPIWQELELETHLLERIVGAKEELVVEPIKLSELLMLNVNSAATVGIVTDIGKNFIKCKLKLPVCATAGSRVTISRRVGTRFRLIGYGVIKEK